MKYPKINVYEMNSSTLADSTAHVFSTALRRLNLSGTRRAFRDLNLTATIKIEVVVF